MITALYTSESGLLSMQKGIDVIGYNIANVNTEAFKKSDVTFKELLQQSYNIAQININPLQKGLGVQQADIRTIMKQGSAISSNSATDLYISGDGFFVLNKDGETVYSRLGKFLFDGGGNSAGSATTVIGANGEIKYYLGNPAVSTPLKLVNPADGAVVQGWMADSTTGAININGSAGNIEISEPYFFMPAKASTYAKLSGSINAAAQISTFNNSTLTGLTYLNGINETAASDFAEKIKLTGNALEKNKGVYNVTVETDGSAIVTFTGENASKNFTRIYPAGTVNTIADGSGTSELIPGLVISFNEDITSNMKLTIKNSGENIKEQFTSINTVVDEFGGLHSLAVTFTKTGENQWLWRSDLINEETFKGTGNAQTFALSSDIDTRYPISITAANGIVTRNIEASQFYVFESNKIVSTALFQPNETISVSYTDKLGNAVTKNFPYPECMQTFVLDKNVDPASVEIFVNGSQSALTPESYRVIGNMILPADLNNDGISDSPYFAPGVDVKIRYKLSAVSKDMIAPVKDEYYGSGKAQDITLTYAPDTAKSITLTALNTTTNETRAIDLSAFTIEGNILKAQRDENGNLISPIIDTNEKLIVDYSEFYEPVNVTEKFTVPSDSYGSGLGLPVTLAKTPDLTTLVIKVNGVVIDPSKYEIGGNVIFPKDTNVDGIPEPLGNAGDLIEISYSFIKQTEGILTFDAKGNVIGGIRSPQISFDIETTPNPLKISLDFENILQQNGTKHFLNGESDGNQEGYLTKLEVYRDGTISGYYSNSETRDIARLAMAVFTNSPALYRAGDSYYTPNPNSGEAQIMAAGYDSRAGIIESYNLEASNVDLATELTNMIVYQRAFQLDAKGIHTANEMLQTAINLKR